MSYQPIYYAVRSQIKHCNTAQVVENAAKEAFDISWQKQQLAEAIQYVTKEQTRPCVLFRPSLSIDGNQWCALYGENLQDGVAGFGSTPEGAMQNFDLEWREHLKARE